MADERCDAHNVMSGDHAVLQHINTMKASCALGHPCVALGGWPLLTSLAVSEACGIVAAEHKMNLSVTHEENYRMCVSWRVQVECVHA